MNDLIKQIKIIIKTPNKKICYESAAHGFLDLLKYSHEKLYIFGMKKFVMLLRCNLYPTFL